MTLKAIHQMLWADIFNATSELEGNLSAVYASEQRPRRVSKVPLAVHYNTKTGRMWFWDETRRKWKRPKGY